MTYNIQQLWNNPSENDWTEVLEKYYSRYIEERNKAIEEEFENIDIDYIKSMNSDEWYQFLEEKYFKWKFTAPNRYASTTKHLKIYKNIPCGLDELHLIKDKLFAFDIDDIAQGLDIAMSIKGLGTAGASGLLAVLFPDKFGTVDQFVAKNLNEVKETYIKNEESLTKKEGVLMIEIMRKKACELNNLFGNLEWTPRKIDMVLWAIR